MHRVVAALVALAIGQGNVHAALLQESGEAMRFEDTFSSEAAEVAQPTLASMGALPALSDAVSEGNFSGARSVYFNYEAPDQTEQAWTLRNLSSEQLSGTNSGLFAGFEGLYDSSFWLDTLARDVLFDSMFVDDNPDVAVGAASRSALSIAITHVVFSLDEAAQAVNNGTNATEPLIRAAATFYGPNGLDSPHELADAMDEQFNTSNAGNLTRRMSILINNNDTISSDELASELEELQADVVVPFYQAAANSSVALDASYAPPDITEREAELEWGKAYASWRAVSGYVYEVDQAAAQDVEDRLAFGTNLSESTPMSEGLYCTVVSSVISYTEELGIATGAYGQLEGVPATVCEGITPEPALEPAPEEAEAPSPGGGSDSPDGDGGENPDEGDEEAPDVPGKGERMAKVEVATMAVMVMSLMLV